MEGEGRREEEEEGGIGECVRLGWASSAGKRHPHSRTESENLAESELSRQLCQDHSGHQMEDPD